MAKKKLKSKTKKAEVDNYYPPASEPVLYPAAALDPIELDDPTDDLETPSLLEQLHVAQFSLESEKRQVEADIDHVYTLITNLRFGKNHEATVIAAEEYLYGSE